MLKNTTIKRILKNSIFKIASIVNTIIPKNDKLVLLYSPNKGVEFSLVPVRDYLLDNGFDKRYRIVCGIKNLSFKDDSPLEFVSKFRAGLLFFKARHVFYTTGQIPIKPSKNQIVIHLRHGNANFKSTGKMTNIKNGDEHFFTYMIASSPLFKPIMAKEYNCSENEIIAIGDPMIDSLMKSSVQSNLFSNYAKFILWLPTFRQSDYLGYDDSTMENLVPLFTESDYFELNELLKKLNIKLLVKTHPAQNQTIDIQRHFSHLDIYTHHEFIEEGLSMERLIVASDALIGDYSSVSMQYLIFNRPLAFVVPDIEEYAQKRGFAFENPEDYMGGHIIKNYNEFRDFIFDIAKNQDPFASKRMEICKQIYQYVDDCNCQRIIKLSEME